MAATTPIRPVKPAAERALKPLASPLEVEVEELLLPVTVVPCPPGWACSPAHWNLPLMTLLVPASLLKTLQELLTSAELWRLKAPRTSPSAGSETLNVVSRESREGECDSWQNLLGEVSGVVKSTTDALQLVEFDRRQVGVVGNLEASTDGGERGHVDARQIRVADERERATNTSQVWCAEGGELVAVEAERAVDRAERRHGHRGDVPHGDVVSPHHVGEVCSHVPAVGLDGERGGNVTQLHVDVVEVVVVRDEHGVNDLEVDAAQALQLCVLNHDGAGGLHTVGEGQTRQGGQGVPVDGLDICEDGEVEVGQDGHVLQAEGVGDGLKGRGRQRGHASDVVSDQAALNLLNAVEGDRVGGARGNGNATGEGGAAREC